MATQPSFLPSAFAVSGDKNSIPASDGGTGAASYAQGFPPVTALPLMAGGVAPDRKDFNGILNILSQFAVFAQAGGTFAYSNTQNYDPGAIVNNNSGALYLCITKNGPGTTAGVKALTNTSYWSPLMANTDVFTGATSGAAGTSGIVPAPAAGEQNKTLLGSGAWGQDPDVTGAKNAGQIGYAKTVNEAVDLDTYQTSGIYYFVWDSGSTNFPVSVGGYLIVITGSGSSVIRQVYFTNHASKAETYTRLYIAGTWRSWVKYINFSDVFTGATSGAAGARGIVPAPAAGAQNKTLMGDGSWGQDPDVTGAKNAGQIGAAKTVTGAVDLDTYQTSGIYYFVWNAGDTNFPVSGVGGYMQVITGSGSNLVRQIFYTNFAAKAETYTRLYNSGTWGSWVKYINYSDTFTGATAGAAGTRGIVPAPAAGAQGKMLMGDGSWGQDAAVTSGLNVGELGGYVSVSGAANMNDYETAGQHIYFVTSSPDHQNWPSGAMSGASYLGGHLFIQRAASALIVRQIFIPFLSARVDIYSRLKTSGGTWGSWALISSSGNTPGINLAPIPTTDPGIGHWQGLNVGQQDAGFNASSFDLPAGGTWAYAILRAIDGAGVSVGVGGFFCGIGAGGATISPAFDATYATHAWRGFCWRIA